MLYSDFIARKTKSIERHGFAPTGINPKMKPFQAYLTERALLAGRYCNFSDCGLGKTFMQLEWADKVTRHTNKPVLVLTPLAVSAQTIDEGHKFGIPVSKVGGNEKIQVTNYEQLDNINPHDYVGVVLDESSILKNFEGKTKKAIIDAFDGHRFKLGCTATPSPNDVMEMANHSEFMNAMARLEMFARYFVHDGGNTSQWRLKGHAEDEFWKFVAGWASFVSKPSDIGFSDEGYVLPPLHVLEHEITASSVGSNELFAPTIVNATNFNATLRDTMTQRVELATQIAMGYDEPCIVWVKHNEESKLAASLMQDAYEVHGSMSVEEKEALLIGFAKGQFKRLVTKAKIAQYGLNYQNCSKQVFSAIDFSFESLYQQIRRSYRFGQTNPVYAHMVVASNMQNVRAAIEEKTRLFNHMKEKVQKYAA